MIYNHQIVSFDVHCPLPEKHPFSTASCRGGHLDQKTGGRTLVRKGEGIFVGAKMQAVRLWLLVQVVGIVNLILPGAGDVFTHVPKVDVILVRTLG